jgi:myosin heavy subunit
MKLKHKVIKEFQFLTPDKKILILKVNTVLEEYVYSQKDESIVIDKDIVDNNPEFFQEVDWRAELLSYLKTNKIPQPAVLSKKLIPFIDEMILGAIPEPTSGVAVDEEYIKELEKRDYELGRKESRLADIEEDIEIRISRIKKREDDYKDDLKKLDKREDELRQRLKDISDREAEVQDKLQDINERERNLESEILNSSQDIDGKYKELQDKINSDLKSLSEKERELEEDQKELKLLADNLSESEADLGDRIRDFEIKVEEAKMWEAELHKLNGEIRAWEGLHWKFQRNVVPPSAIQ